MQVHTKEIFEFLYGSKYTNNSIRPDRLNSEKRSKIKIRLSCIWQVFPGRLVRLSESIWQSTRSLKCCTSILATLPLMAAFHVHRLELVEKPTKVYHPEQNNGNDGKKDVPGINESKHTIGWVSRKWDRKPFNSRTTRGLWERETQVPEMYNS